MKRRSIVVASLANTTFLIAGCSTGVRASSPKASEYSDAALYRYAGRMSLVIDASADASVAPQSFSGSFELRGNAQAGELDLLSPLGQIVMQLRWQPQLAEILRGNERQQFASADQLLLQATGAALSLAQLFDWLQGKTSSSETGTAGQWRVDLAAQPQGRIIARRSLPTPAVLRIALDQP